MTYAVHLLQGAFRGSELEAHATDLLVLSLITVICTGTGSFLYRKKSWE